MASLNDTNPVKKRSNAKVAFWTAFLAFSMLGLGFASVPLYRLFCQVTGFGGTTMRVSEEVASKVQVRDGQISIRFDANVDPALPWTFRPEKVTETANLGGRRMAIYLARNDSDQPITGVATFNVEPQLAGKYFNKVQCFCFNEQTLQPGQEVRMPVVYYVDPAIHEDPDTKNIEQITLSYTFFQSNAATAEDGTKALDRTETEG